MASLSVISLLIIGVAFIAGIVGFGAVFVLLYLAKKDLEKEPAFSTDWALKFISDTLDEMISGDKATTALRQFSLRIPQLVSAVAKDSIREEDNIAYDVVAAIQIPLLQNLNDPNELGLQQLTGQCGVQWILCGQPPDIASIYNGGWYERLLRFLEGGGVAFYFCDTDEYVRYLCKKISDDPRRNRPIELNPKSPHCQVWYVPCAELSLLYPESVIWNPLGYESNRCRGYMNTGESLDFLFDEERGYILRDRNRFPISDMDNKMLKSRFQSACRIFRDFLQSTGMEDLIVQHISKVMVKEELTHEDILRILALNKQDALEFIENRVDSHGIFAVIEGGASAGESR